jgi:hypothetical protein
MGTDADWIRRYNEWQQYGLAERLARSFCATSLWAPNPTPYRTCREWANWMVAALRTHGVIGDAA